jgi:hypothetical protein
VAVGVAEGGTVGVGVAVAVCVFVGVAVGVGCVVAVALGLGSTLTLGFGVPVAVKARVADGASVATCFRDRGATPKGIKATMAASAKAMAATNQICRG